MNRFLLSIFVLLVVLCTSCKSHPQSSLDAFSEVIYTPQYATGFDIAAAKGAASTLLTIRNPWQGANGVVQQLFLARAGELPPEAFSGQVVRLPIRHAVCMSSSHVAMFESLGQSRRISGVSGIDYISNAYINAHKLCGEVRDVGYDTNVNFELLAAMRPDIVLLYSVTGGNTAVTGKLQELGIPYLYIGDYVEESPLGKAEWLVAIAELLDSRTQGQEHFAQLTQRYQAESRRAALCQTAPKVMLNTPYRDTWFMPSPQSYMVRLITDAGGSYVYKAGRVSNSSTPIDIEEAYLLARQADFWINTGACNNMEELCTQNPRFASLPVVRTGQVYNNNLRQTPSGGSDFWESGVVRPDRVLHDLINLLHPELSDGQWSYYKKLE